MTRFDLRSVTAAILAIFCTLPPAAEAGSQLREPFYADTPFGSLAWVRSVATKSAARTKRVVFGLAGEACTELPGSGSQWFLINHRDEELVGQTGYFSVRILYAFEPNQTTSGLNAGIHLQRNSNWFDAKGTKITDDYERNSFQIPLTEESFIALHSPGVGAEHQNLAKLEEAVGNWHLKPKADSASSWEDRYLYGPMLRAYSSPTIGAISARLIRFTATSSAVSGEPLLFWLDPRGAKSATILVDAPRQAYTGTRVYTVRFDGNCP